MSNGINSLQEAMSRLTPEDEREIAIALGVARTTVRSWRERDYVLPEYWRRLREQLAERGMRISAERMEVWHEARRSQ